MSYLVLARKWRPTTFADLVGQEHVTQTLRNAISQGRVAHAFLFTGARGVGKTTIARILAKALNCLGRSDATTEPCLTCAACTEIALGRDPDVQEIDGASHNGVDSIRTLQETLPYRPQRDRFKVIIIDEVHMVSTAAFNALLKTLEEPPPHVKFIFATTEAHKVPVTILSRCQRYDFRLIPTQKIRERVAVILTAEEIPYEDGAVSLIAREAAGSLRDALSLLDQVIAGFDGTLTESATARLLGVADRKVLYDLMRAVLSGDPVGALRCIESVAREGYDLLNVAHGILEVARDLVIARVVPDPNELLDIADDERAEVRALASSVEAVDLERLFVAWARAVEDVGRAREPRWVLEMAAVRLCHRPPLLPVEELLGRLVDLERRLASGGAPPDPTRGASPRPSSPPAPAPAPVSPGASAFASRLPTSRRPGDDPPRSQSSSTPAVSRAPGSTPTTAPVLVAPVLAASVARVDERFVRERQRATEAPAVSPAPAIAEQATLDTSAVPTVLPIWQMLVNEAQGSLTAVMKVAVPLVVSGQLVRLGVDVGDSFIRKKLSTPDAQQMITDAAERVFGTRPVVEIVQGTLPDGPLSIAKLEDATRLDERARNEAIARNHPLVLAVVEALGGEIGRVRLDGDPN